MRDVHSIVVFAVIDRFPNYRIGTDGSVWSNVSKRFLRGYIDRDGYRLVNMTNHTGARLHRVHRLVLEAFVCECPEGMEGCHDNDIPNDNRLANLRWGYPKHNAEDRIKNGNSGKGKKNSMAKLSDDAIRELRLDRENGMTLAQLSAKYGVCFQHASLIAKRKRWAHL